MDIANLAYLFSYDRYKHINDINKDLFFCQPQPECRTGMDVFQKDDNFHRSDATVLRLLECVSTKPLNDKACSWISCFSAVVLNLFTPADRQHTIAMNGPGYHNHFVSQSYGFISRILICRTII